MLIGGLKKFTLIDYPKHLACTVFTAGCNFRCPFCHNPELVVIDKNQYKAEAERDFFDFLKTRQGKLEGVCITGGEPTIQKDILKFMTKIKKMGFEVKLDTNGTNPEVLKEGFKRKIIDFVAMDIKNSLKNYERACGIKIDLEKIKESVDLIKQSGQAYEFRTTVVPTIHQKKDFQEIGKWLRGVKKYVLQAYQDEGKILDNNLRKKIKNDTINLTEIKSILEKNIKQVEIRQ